MNRVTRTAACIMGSIVVGAAVFQHPHIQAQPSQVIRIDGSSTVYPITEAAVNAFRQTRDGRGVQADLAFSGTSGGFRKFCQGEIDIANASRPILKAEMETCKKNAVNYIEVPVAFDALTVVIHPKNTWATQMTLQDLQKMWEPAAEGKIKTWQQVRPSWPSQAFKLLGPGTDSGTFDYFTEAVMGTADRSRLDYVKSEDDEVIAQGVIKNSNALGYFGYHYYKLHQVNLKAVGINSGNGFIVPSPDTVQNNRYQPLSRPLFIYINARSSQINKPIRKFVTYYLNNAEKLVKSVDYITLHSESYHQAKVHFYRGKIGTVFGGKQQQNLTLRQLLRKQAEY